MDDAAESDVLCEAFSILMRVSVRSLQDFRTDIIARVELPSLQHIAGGGGGGSGGRVGRSSPLFLPLLLGLFGLGLVALAARNEHIQAWALVLSHLFRRLARKLKMAVMAFAMAAGPARKPDLLHLQLHNSGSSWDFKAPSGQAACYAIQGRRPRMEDRFTLVEKLAGTPLHLFAVYDGHGGEVSLSCVWREDPVLFHFISTILINLAYCTKKLFS